MLTKKVGHAVVGSGCLSHLLLQAIASDVKQAFAVIGPKHGVALEYRGCSYTDTQAKARFLITALNPKTGKARDVTRDDFRRLATFYGLEPADLDRVFTCRGDKWQLMGLRPRSRRYPFLCKNLRTGTTYRLHLSDVRTGLGLDSVP